MNRRHFLLHAPLAGGATLSALSHPLRAADGSPHPAAYSDAASGAAKAHQEIWRRFIDEHDVMIDFTALDGSVSLPTPEECRLGKPNALGWWSPIENGPMFNGQYMEALTNHWLVTKDPAIAGKARRLMKGLLFLNTVSDVPGFIARGVSTDGKSHYPMGSNDQTFPWYYGLWRYRESGIATDAERQEILDRLLKVTEIIRGLGWHMPAEPPFNIRGRFVGFTFEDAPRVLFVCKLLFTLTGEEVWQTRYLEALAETGGEKEEKLSRIEWCEKGMSFDTHKHSWTAVCGVAALRGLWEMEKDEALRARYAKGLQNCAAVAMDSLSLAGQFDNADTSHFEHDWRVMNAEWKPQQTEHEAVRLAEHQLRGYNKISPRRNKETHFVREPTFAAWIVTLAPDRELLRQRAAAVEKVIAHYDYEKLIYSQFFPVESAWWRLKMLDA